MTHVIFHTSGEISTRVAESDYSPLSDRCSYAGLCSGLGNTFYDILQRHREGENDLILREIRDETRQAVTVLILVGLLVLLLALLLYFHRI